MCFHHLAFLVLNLLALNCLHFFPLQGIVASPFSAIFSLHYLTTDIFLFSPSPVLPQLCTTLDTAKKLIESANSNVMVLSENVGELENIIKKGESAIAEVRSIHSSLSQRIDSATKREA